MRRLWLLLAIATDLVASMSSVDPASAWDSELRTRMSRVQLDLALRSHRIQRRSGRRSPRAQSPARSPDHTQIPTVGAGVEAHGPAYIKVQNPSHSGHPFRYIPHGARDDEARGHPRGVHAVGVLPPHHGQLGPERPLKVIAMGYTAKAGIVTGPGGSGRIRTKSPEAGMQEIMVPADSSRTATVTSGVPGGAAVHAIISRPGRAEAYGLGDTRTDSRSGSNELQ